MSSESVLFANNLDYKLPTPSSVVTNRVLKRNYFQNRSYGEGQTMVCTLSTGTDQVDLKNSSLVLQIKTSKNAVGTNYQADFGEGSAVNLVKNMRINHRSGTTYTNTQKLNQWRKVQDRYNESSQWFASVGSLMGYDQKLDFGTTAGREETKLAIIPLSHLHPFFAPEGGKLLPSVMASGMRIEIDLEAAATAFYERALIDTGSLGSYEILGCYIETMNISLMDSAQASLNTVAQQSSLEYVFKDIFTSQNSHPSNNTQVNIDVNKSVAFADTAYAIVQPQANLNDIEIDGFRTQYISGKFDWTLGSNHYPNVKIDNEPSAYHTALVTFDKFKSMVPTDVTFEKFLASDGVYAVSLERDTALALSQSPVNASRALRFELAFDTAPTTASLITVYMSYLTSVRSTLLSSRVDI
jgi:hypothetical protein